MLYIRQKDGFFHGWCKLDQIFVKLQEPFKLYLESLGLLERAYRMQYGLQGDGQFQTKLWQS
jgi:hypothetical protein